MRIFDADLDSAWRMLASIFKPPPALSTDESRRMWKSALRGCTVDDLNRAVEAYAKTATRWPKPSEIRDMVSKVNNDAGRYWQPPPPPPGEPGCFGDLLEAFAGAVAPEDFAEYEAHRALRSGEAPSTNTNGATRPEGTK